MGRRRGKATVTDRVTTIFFAYPCSSGLSTQRSALGSDVVIIVSWQRMFNRTSGSETTNIGGYEAQKVGHEKLELRCVCRKNTMITLEDLKRRSSRYNWVYSFSSSFGSSFTSSLASSFTSSFGSSFGSSAGSAGLASASDCTALALIAWTSSNLALNS